MLSFGRPQPGGIHAVARLLQAIFYLLVGAGIAAGSFVHIASAIASERANAAGRAAVGPTATETVGFYMSQSAWLIPIIGGLGLAYIALQSIRTETRRLRRRRDDFPRP